MTLHGKHIFILGTARFDAEVETTSFTIAKHLAKNNFVYYIDYPFTTRDCIRLKNATSYKKRKPFFHSSSNGIIESGITNLNIIITPPVFSINFLPEGKIFRKALKINERIIVNRIKKVIKEKRVSELIYINSFNFHFPQIANALNTLATIYHCVDPMIIPYDMKHGIISEEILVRNSDLVICTSKQLYREKKLQNNNTEFIPNAADIRHSSLALNNNLTVHPKIAELRKPVIGYFGNIERRIDFALVKEVASMNKEKSFVFVGPISQEFVPQGFFEAANIHYIERQPYAEMPSVLKGFDVALLPFKKDEVSNTIFPLKLFEYLGAGKPVVATDFNPDLYEFTGKCVSYCSNAEEFSLAIEDCLLNENKQRIQERLAVAKENTWEKRVEKISELLENLLNEKATESTHLKLNLAS
jgi:glycosyltransferase involved in cell wall biosynthesis